MRIEYSECEQFRGPDGSGNAFDIRVGMETPAEMQSSEDVLSETRHQSVGSQ